SDRFVRQIVELAQTLLKSNARGDDLIALIVALLACLRRNRPDQALARCIERSRSKSREAEVGHTGGEHFRDSLVGIVGGHRKIDAFRLEVTFCRSQEQRAVFAQPLRADNDTLLRIGRKRQSGNENKNRDRESNHARRLAESGIRDSERRRMRRERTISNCRRSAGCGGRPLPDPRSWSHRKYGMQARARRPCPAPPRRPRP